jgi:phosphoglycolate phosphatase
MAARDLPTVVFDTDGTLIDARGAVVEAVAEGLQATYRHFQLPAAEPDRERIQLAMGLPAGAFFRTSFDPATVPAVLHAAFAGEFELRSTRAEVAALHRGETSLYPGVEDALTALAERGHALALFSNAAEPYFRAVVEVHGLDRFFGRTLCLETAVRTRVARHKTGMVRHLLDGCADAVVVGDRVHDIDAGRAAGARTVGCLYGFGAAEEFRRADWTVASAVEIAQLPLAAAPVKGEAGAQDTAQG